MTTETTPTAEYLDNQRLAVRYVEDLEAEAAFDPVDFVLGDEIPADIYNYLSSDPSEFEDHDEMMEAIEDAYESWYGEWDSLDISASVGLGESLYVKTVTVVFGTGGPHIEATLQPGGTEGYVTVYGWFGANKVSLPFRLTGNHPIQATVDWVIERIEE